MLISVVSDDFLSFCSSFLFVQFLSEPRFVSLQDFGSRAKSEGYRQHSVHTSRFEFSRHFDAPYDLERKVTEDSHYLRSQEVKRAPSG